MSKYFLAILCMSTFLTGCSLLSPIKAPKENTYVLNTVPDVKKKPRQNSVLIVLPVEVDNLYDTTDMAYRDKPYQISYYGKNKWAETPGLMFQQLIIQTLQKGHHFKAVMSPPYVGEGHYELKTQIVELLQDLHTYSPQVKFKVRIQVLKMPSMRVVAAKQFTVTEHMQAISPAAGVIASNHAAARVLTQINQCLNHLP